jgi:hypothetical protein
VDKLRATIDSWLRGYRLICIVSQLKFNAKEFRRVFLPRPIRNQSFCLTKFKVATPPLLPSIKRQILIKTNRRSTLAVGVRRSRHDYTLCLTKICRFCSDRITKVKVRKGGNALNFSSSCVDNHEAKGV